ncbi:MAG: hypothetical protein D6681_17020 [Calditrichaeota bacterium]|nr:MAG: hypothetical protein D6681_17020 [Calditrichota bacterium]
MAKFLPVGVSDFRQLIEGNFLYVDKTAYIYELVRPPQAFYFLSRPRRFGKSLLVSTLRELFQAQQKLFKGLWIEGSDWAWQPHPVVMFDFSGIANETPRDFRDSLLRKLRQIGERYRLSLDDAPSIPEAVVWLISRIAEQTGERVVVLMDEYDKPLIEHLGRGEEHLQIARENRDILRQFMGAFKAAEVMAALRFVFITGISKFSKVSLFSGLNNLEDLSMHEEYAALLGYEESEIETYFAEHLRSLARKLKLSVPEVMDKIREWYDGYRFSSADVKVYNPFSVLKALKEKEFGNYWFETATPAFLIDLIKAQNYPIPELESLRIAPSQFTTYDLEYLSLEPLLFQTGYLTIQDYDGLLYELGYPNREVKISFTEFLYNQLVPIGERGIRAQYRLLAAYLVKGELEAFVTTVNRMLAAIPYVHIQGQDEHYYHTVFYLMLTAGGIAVHTEVLTSRGRMDMAVEAGNRVYVIELKCNQSAEEALHQIKERGYADRYRGKGRKVILLGINFDTGRREVSEWKVEELS